MALTSEYQGRNIKARFRVRGPLMEMVEQNRASIDENGSLQQELVKEEMKVWYVYVPSGSANGVPTSVRFCGDAGFKEMQRMGYTKRPRLIDMETGDVLDIGGNEFDFSSIVDESNISVVDDEETNPSSSRKKSEG